MIKYCPSCRHELHKPKGSAQGIKGCKNCESRYFMLETTPPKDSGDYDVLQPIISSGIPREMLNPKFLDIIDDIEEKLKR